MGSPLPSLPGVYDTYVQKRCVTYIVLVTAILCSGLRGGSLGLGEARGSAISRWNIRPRNTA